MTLFEAVVRGPRQLPPERPAVICGEASLGFGELVRGARAIASRLHALGLQRGERLGLWMGPSPRLVQSLLGVLGAGGAVVPLDPHAVWSSCRPAVASLAVAGLFVDGPRASVSPELLDGLDARLLLVDGIAGPGGPAPRLAPGGAILMLDEALSTRAQPLPRLAPGALAAVIGATGETGTGAMHTHQGGLASMQWLRRTFAFHAADQVAVDGRWGSWDALAPVFAALCAGATLRLLSHAEAQGHPDLVRQLPLWGVTVWCASRAAVGALLDRGELERLGSPTLRLLLVSGELSRALARRLRHALPRVRICALHARAETGAITWAEVPFEPVGDEGPVLGRACGHLEAFLVDDRGQSPEGADETGTLWVRGPGLMTGYWNPESRAGDGLQADPRGQPGLAFCTGERCTRRADGSYARSDQRPADEAETPASAAVDWHGPAASA